MDGLRLISSLNEKGERVPFDIQAFSCDTTKETGGELIDLKGVVKCGLPYSMKDNFSIGVRLTGSSEHPTAIHCRLITKINGQQISY